MLLASLTEISRLQFAITAMFHWVFVPLTIGLGLLIAIMESCYVRTGNEFWKKTTKFWMNIFAINFAVGIATGLILEFQFGTTWSNYSWFVGDIFGAPLAIEGIFAFFMESTFFAIMFFGWNKVSKKAHLASTWLVSIGTMVSALWILVANSWMQFPTGMEFNPDTTRSEMVDFWAVAFSPVAMNKLIHTLSNCFVLGSIVVIGISSWYLLRGREKEFAYKSIKLASIFGAVSLVVLLWSGHSSSTIVAKKQPMKLAAMEALYRGEEGTPLVAVGILNGKKSIELFDSNLVAFEQERPYIFDISIPKGLSLLADSKLNSFVPGIQDIIDGYTYTTKDGNVKTVLPMEQRIEKGKIAINALAEYKKAKETGDETMATFARAQLKENFEHFGYGYFEKPSEAIPNIPLTFYTFRIMVLLGGFFILFFIVAIVLSRKEDKIYNSRWFQYTAIISVPLVYICSQSGWIVAEVGRQPWTIQDLLPVKAAISAVETSSVVTTTVLFLVLFGILLAAELTIMFKVIKKGPAI